MPRTGRVPPPSGGVLAIAVWLGMSGVASAQSRTSSVAAAKLAEDPRLSVGTLWPAGSIRTQLDRDQNLIPYGKGALFVPAMTSGLDEPPVEVLRGSRRVAEGTAGTRIFLFPGTYQVRVGSGASSQRLNFQATIRELSTTVIPVSWSGLTVHIVDERYGSLRSSYELIRVEDREYMGIGFGTDEQAGEPISTWVLKPGLYKIVRVGENYRARRDFVTVRLLRGKHTHFLLVIDEETGEFQGGGEVPANELFRPSEGVYGSLVIGGDLTGNIRNNIPTQTDGLTVAARAFVDGRLSIMLFENPLAFQLQIEEGFTNAPDAPITKTSDRLDLDALYIYRLEPWIGPYVRLGVETNIFPNERRLSTDGFVVRRDSEGRFIDRSSGPVSAFETSPPIGLSNVREGIGLNVRLFKSVSTEMNVRAGFGARHRITRDLFVIDECSRDPDGGGSTSVECLPFEPAGATAPTYIFRQDPGIDQIGAELTLLATARITRFILLNLEADALFTSPFRESVVEGEASLAFKLTSFVSLNYVLRYERDPTIPTDIADQFEQDILLRFSVDIL